MTSATPQVTNVEVKDGVLYSITLWSEMVVGYTACGLSWFRYEGGCGVNVPLSYGVNPEETDGVDRTYEICCDVAVMIGADLGYEARHYCYPSWIIRDDGSECERITYEWAGRPDHDWVTALAVDAAQTIDTNVRFDRDGRMVGRMLELETGQIVTLCGWQPEEVVEESFNIWSQLCLTR